MRHWGENQAQNQPGRFGEDSGKGRGRRYGTCGIFFAPRGSKKEESVIYLKTQHREEECAGVFWNKNNSEK